MDLIFKYVRHTGDTLLRCFSQKANFARAAVVCEGISTDTYDTVPAGPWCKAMYGRVRLLYRSDGLRHGQVTFAFHFDVNVWTVVIAKSFQCFN